MSDERPIDPIKAKLKEFEAYARAYWDLVPVLDDIPICLFGIQPKMSSYNPRAVREYLGDFTAGQLNVDFYRVLRFLRTQSGKWKWNARTGIYSPGNYLRYWECQGYLSFDEAWPQWSIRLRKYWKGLQTAPKHKITNTKGGTL